MPSAIPSTKMKADGSDVGVEMHIKRNRAYG